MTETRSKSLSIVYNGTEIWEELKPYLQSFSYTDGTDQSDTISLMLNDRDKKWSGTWTPQKKDMVYPTIEMKNWNYEGEQLTISCGDFIVDDYSFNGPPLTGSINGVSSPVQTSFKETQKSKTWESATVQLIAAEIAGNYGLTLYYDASDIPISKMEQSKQTDSDFLLKLCEKYGLGLKIYSNRIVIWDYKRYYAQDTVLTIHPQDVSKWQFRSTMQGTYTGAKVSYTIPKTKKTVEVLVGTEERLCKINQKADNEADARLMGEAAILNANRKETTMQLTMSPKFSLFATKNVQLEDFGAMDGKYFIDKITHQISRNNYSMQVSLYKIADQSGTDEEGSIADQGVNNAGGNEYIIKKGDTLWKLSQKFYGDPTKSQKLYEANKNVIEAAARQHGKAGSSNGYWIWEGTKLVIP